MFPSFGLGSLFGGGPPAPEEDPLDAFIGPQRPQQGRQGHHRQPIKTPGEHPRHGQQQGGPPGAGVRGGGRGVQQGQHSRQQAQPHPHPAPQQQQQQRQHAGRAQQQQARAPQRRATPAAQLTPDQAATIIQTAWRCTRLARHRPALLELARAAGQLRAIRAREQALLAEQPGQPLTQKQYLELSETVMKVLFALDAVTPGVPELRAKRKELTTSANQLLDELQAVHKDAPAPAPGSAVAAAPKPAAPVPQQPPQPPQPQGRKWFRH